MNKKLMVVVGLSMLLSAWLMLSFASPIHPTEPGSLKTVTLRIEGMT